ncbi:MAG: galactokinase [Pseudomonadota bacterium]
MTNDELSQRFAEIYGGQPEAIASAPGRVNIIGEFTDYNNGFVLPCALEFRTQVAYRQRSDNSIVAHSLQYPGQKDEFPVDRVIEPGTNQWGNYVRAVAFIIETMGVKLGGMDLLIESNVPQGAGLSSSAALEVAVGGAINAAFNLGFSPTELAQIGQSAENDFMNCQCGIMDQLVSACGQRDNALLIDCLDLTTQLATMPGDLVLLIINSNYPRKLVDSEYNDRREDCQAAADAMQVSSLRDADLSALEGAKTRLTDTQYRRAKHVITENQRVLDALDALRNSHIETLSTLMAASQMSLRNDFEVTVPATDWIVDKCTSIVGKKGAARQTGGGFGGAVVCLCQSESVEDITRKIEVEYPKATGLHADIFRCVAGDGLSITPRNHTSS